MADMANPTTNVTIPTVPGGATLANESLRQTIERLTPEETPFYSNTRKGPNAKALREDWGTVALGSITAAPAEKRGFEATIKAAIVPVRLDNMCELTAETGGVADSYNAIDLAGRDDESDFQELLKGQLLKRRVNALLYANQAKSSVEPTTMACFPTWVGGNRFQSIATTPGTASAGNGSDTYVAGNGADQLETIDPVDEVMEACYATNGMPKVIYMAPNTKRQWSKIPDASVAENRINMSAGTAKPFMFIGTVDLYLSDFGLLEVVPDRDCPQAIMPMVDPRFIEIRTLPGRAWKKTTLAKTGSSEKFMLEWEGTLVVTNPTAHGMVEGIAAL